MNKTPSIYREKFKKKSSTDVNATDDTSSNRKYNFIRRKNLSIYHDRSSRSHRKGDSPKLRESKNSVADGALLDADYIENLVTKVKELKSRMLYFERQCPETSNTLFDYQNRNQSIGDCESTDLNNRSKNHKYNVSDNNIYPNKYNSNTRNYFDHQKSIYTANEQKYSPLYSENDRFQNSKTKSNKTNVSIVMSMHSSKKDVNANKAIKQPNPKQFQAAAEEFIQQAEDLKSKIGYILDCCGYNTPGSSYTASSLTSASSKKCFSKRSSTRKNSSANVTNDQLKHINEQYQEILKTLVSIDQNIKGFAKAHMMASKFGRTGSNTSVGSITKSSKKSKSRKRSEPKVKDADSNPSVLKSESKTENKLKKGQKKKKADKGCDRESCKSLHNVPPPEKKGSSWSCMKPRPTSSDISIDKKNIGTKRDSKDKKKPGKSRRNSDKLEPIVMVYEPIEPNSANFQRCSQEQHPPSKICSKRPSSESKKSEKHGFVVTYTPNIKTESSTSLCTSKKSGKMPCCFGF